MVFIITGGWLGVIIAVDVSVFGWLIATAQGPNHALGANLLPLILAGVLVALLSALAVFLHSKIDGWIDDLKTSLTMETYNAILILGFVVVLVLAGIAFDAARR